jgi:TPR repeat protein
MKLTKMHFLLIGYAVPAIAVAFFLGRAVEHDAYAAPAEKMTVAIEALRSGNDAMALSLFKPLADGGDSKAQYWLADMYENGLGVKQDKTAALGLLKDSAAQGFVLAEQRLGELYLSGSETLQDFGKASTWLRKAAVAGNGRAERDVGNIFALGLGVNRDPVQAYAWYENAILHGDGPAKNLRDGLVAKMSADDIAKGEEAARDIATKIPTSEAA